MEIVPLHVRSTTVGIFLFVMNNIGGNLPIAVEPVSKSIGYRESLYIFYVAFYLISNKSLSRNSEHTKRCNLQAQSCSCLPYF